MSYDYTGGSDSGGTGGGNNGNYEYPDYLSESANDYYKSGYGSIMLTQNELYANLSILADKFAALPPNMPTTVSVWMAMMKTLYFTNGGLLQVTAMMIIQWVDPRLTWNSTVSSCNVLQMPTEGMWIPEIILLNSADSSLSIVTPGNAKTASVFNDGLVTLYIPSIFTAYCTLNLMKFPFDSQSCTLNFVSFTTNTTIPAVNFTVIPNNVPFRFYSTTGEFTLYNYSLSVNDNLCLVTTCFANFNLKLNYSRRSSYYVMTVVVPTILLSILLALSLIIPSDSVIKITVACTLMLSLYTLQQTVARLLPATENPPMLSIGTLCSLILASICVVICIMSVIIRMYQPTLGPGLLSFLKRLICTEDHSAPAKVIPSSGGAMAETNVNNKTDLKIKVDKDKNSQNNTFSTAVTKFDDSSAIEDLLSQIIKGNERQYMLKVAERRSARETEIKRAREHEQARGWRIMDTSINISLFVVYVTTAIVCLLYYETSST